MDLPPCHPRHQSFNLNSDCAAAYLQSLPFSSIPISPFLRPTESICRGEVNYISVSLSPCTDSGTFSVIARSVLRTTSCKSGYPTSNVTVKQAANTHVTFMEVGMDASLPIPPRWGVKCFFSTSSPPGVIIRSHAPSLPYSPP